MMAGARECFAGECVERVAGWPSGWQIVAGVILAGVLLAGVRAGR